MPDVTQSWCCRLTCSAASGPAPPQQTEDGAWALRVGLQAITGVGQQAAERLVQRRPSTGYSDLYDLCRRTALPKRIVTV